MPTIRVTSSLPELCLSLAKRLEEENLGPVEIHAAGAVGTYKLVHRANVAPADLTKILAAISPFEPEHWETVRDLPADSPDVEIVLGDSLPLKDWNVHIRGEDSRLLDRAQEELLRLGFRIENKAIHATPQAAIAYGGATAFARHLVRWWASRHGIDLPERLEWDTSDKDIYVDLIDSATAHLDPRARYQVAIFADDIAEGTQLGSHLDQRGFRCRVEQRSDERFVVNAGPFRQQERGAERSVLATLLEGFLRERGVDLELFPIESGCVPGQGDLEAAICLPLKKVLQGNSCPYGGDVPARFAVRIETDDPGRAEPLAAQLRTLGFQEVVTVGQERLLDQWYVELGGLSANSELGLQLDAQVRALRPEGTQLPLPMLQAPEGKPEKDTNRIIIAAPFSKLSASTLEARRKLFYSQVNIHLVHHRSVDVAPMLAELKGMGFKSVKTMRGSHFTTPGVVYGGASPEALLAMQSFTERFTGQAPRMICRWKAHDDDIFLEISKILPCASNTDAAVSSVLVGHFCASEDSLPEDTRPFIAMSPRSIRVGKLTLPRVAKGSALVPPQSVVREYCIDGRTAETVQHIARSVLLREPCLLEGETSTSKTSAIIYLAALLRQPVVRLNLHGQTDTGELLGRYQPTDGTTGARWAWHDGAIVRAMRDGTWVILDELNLAEPQVLERLNSLLERTPSLVLSEHDGRVFGSGGEPIHARFRLFATMNPAEYAGRYALSPAYRDRWRGYCFVEPPTEHELAAMLRLFIEGRQPESMVQGCVWAPVQGKGPLLPKISNLPGVSNLVEPLARFHVAVEQAVRRGTNGGQRLGSRRREAYVFTRRSLLSVLAYLDQFVGRGADRSEKALSLGFREALSRYYLDRLADDADREVLRQLLDAAGIGPRTWTLPAPPPRYSAPPQSESQPGSADDLDAEIDAMLERAS